MEHLIVGLVLWTSMPPQRLSSTSVKHLVFCWDNINVSECSVKCVRPIDWCRRSRYALVLARLDYGRCALVFQSNCYAAECSCLVNEYSVSFQSIKRCTSQPALVVHHAERCQQDCYYDVQSITWEHTTVLCTSTCPSSRSFSWSLCWQLAPTISWVISWQGLPHCHPQL